MNKRSEKKEYMKIVNEIDTILFGTPVKKVISKLQIQDIVSGFIFSAGVVGITTSYVDEEQINSFVMLGVAIACGIGGTILSYKDSEKGKAYIERCEEEYLSLSRKEQLEVLKLAKRLTLAIKEEIIFKQNKEYFENYLDQKDNLNMFDRFEANHPHFEMLSQERIDEIHANGKLTPTEIFNEWMSSRTCIPCDKRRCKEFGNCRDCLVDYANQQEEWNTLTFKQNEFFASITKEGFNSNPTDINQEDKSRTLKK